MAVCCRLSGNIRETDGAKKSTANLMVFYCLNNTPLRPYNKRHLPSIRP